MKEPFLTRKKPWIGGHPSLQFVNTLDWRFRKEGPKEHLRYYGDLLLFAKETGALSSELADFLAVNVTSDNRRDWALSVAKEIREDIANACYASLEQPPSTHNARMLSLWASVAKDVFKWFGEQGPNCDWVAEASKQQGVELPLWKMSLMAERFVKSPDFAKIKACKNQECRRLFLDESKNRSRNWCDMDRCGSRLKSEKFQKKTEPQGPIEK